MYGLDDRILFSGDTVFTGGYYDRWDPEGGDTKVLVLSLKHLTKLDVEMFLSVYEKSFFYDVDMHFTPSYIWYKASFHNLRIPEEIF